MELAAAARDALRGLCGRAGCALRGCLSAAGPGAAPTPPRTPPEADARAPLGHQEHYNIRLLEPSEFESAESLQEECKEFLEKITQFNALVQSITQVFEAHANQIQTEKLKTIGLRNIIDMQRENQRRKEQQLGADVEDTTHELERLTRTYESLMKVEGEQRILIDKLSNSEL